MDSDFPMKKSQLEDFISRWESVQVEGAINQLLSETVNFLTYCIGDSASAQKVKESAKVISPPCAIDGQMIIPIQQVYDDGTICQILQDVKNSITAHYVRMRKADDVNYSSFNDPLLCSR